MAMTIEQQRALALARARVRARQGAPAPRGQRIREEGAAVLSGIERGMQPIAEALDYLNPLSYFGPQKSEQTKKQLARQGATQQQAKPNYFAGGQIIGETAATAPFVAGAGGVIQSGGKLLTSLAPKLRKVGDVVQRVGVATRTGGIGSGRTAAQTAATTRGQRALQLAERSAGGAISGVTTAALTGQDKTDAALFGAGLPIVANVLKRAGGKFVDLKNLSKVKAGKIIRESLGENLEAAKAAFRALSPDDQRLAQQVLIEAGVEPSPYFGLGKIASSQIDPDTPANILAAQKTARGERLADISGGDTATAQRAAAEAGRRDVNIATGPARDAALARTNVVGETVSNAEALANAARQQAAEQSDLARRMTFGAERAETRLGQVDDLGDVFNPNAVGRERGIAGAMTQRGETAAQQAIGLRQQARDMEDVVADLAAEGMQPLRVSPIVQQLRSMAGQPGTRADELQRDALTGLANRLEGLADPNGVIDARDLYQIRKTGLNDIVETLLSGRQPGSGTKERTASLLTSARGMIDNAIEGAGGKGWKDYLVRTRQGFETVNRQKLAGQGAQLAEEKPNEFIALMSGKRPKMVEDVMGTGQFDIAGMALADPRRYNAMKMSADELETLNKMADLEGRGATRAANILKEQQPGALSKAIGTIVRTKYPALSFAGTGTQGAANAIVTPNVQREIANSFTSGRDALQAIEQYPTATQISEYISSLPSPVRNAFAQAMRAYSTNPQR